MDEQLRKIVRIISSDVLFSAPARIIGTPIEIYDILGPLLFFDYVVEAEDGRIGWVRTLPDAYSDPKNAFISAQLGSHPALQKQVYYGSIKKMLSNEFKLFNNLERTKSFKDRSCNYITERILASRASDGEEKPKLYCYSYPSLGVEVIKEETGEIGFIDIEDSSFFRVTESGVDDTTDTTEGPCISSFLENLSESGESEDYEVPKDEYIIPNVPLLPQLKNNWCAAASCQMVLVFHGFEVTQEYIADLMKIPDNPQYGGAASNIQNRVYEQAADNKVTATYDVTPTLQECIKELSENRPVKNANYRHARVNTGWKNSEYGVLYRIHDPLPVNKGSVKYENPIVVHPKNFIYLKRSDTE